jgi:PKD repeat protein
VVVPGGTYYLAIQGTGNGDPLSLGYSSYGSIGRYSMSVSAPVAGAAPAAVISSSATTGVAPLTVSFSGAGSTGTVASYEWNFGDGSPIATGVSASHSYTVAGSYSATLKVTNSAGFTDTRAIAVTATSPQLSMFVGSIGMQLVSGRMGQAYAQASVAVKDSNGRLIPGATVSGTWSGIVAGASTVVTNASGVALVNSPSTKKAGTFKFAVTGISAPGYAYNAGLNVVVSNAITR